MYWNRFDICLAYYCYAMLNHHGQNSKEHALLGALDRIGFRPSPLLRDENDLEENARAIYDHLVAHPHIVRDREEVLR